MHVLFLPKWYPGPNDPQLGDFLRKQAIAVARHQPVSVLVPAPLKGPIPGPGRMQLNTADGPWELSCYYSASTVRWTALRKVINLWRYWSAARNGWRRIVKERGLPDLIHVHILIRPALLAWWFGRRHRIPYLISEQSSEYLDGTYVSKGPLVKFLSRWLCGKAKAVTAVSSYLGDALVKHGLCTDPQVVPNVVPGLDRPLPPSGDPKHFLVVADLVDRTKNVSGVIKALAGAQKEVQALSLTIIGDGQDRQGLEKLAAQLTEASSVTFLGRLANRAVLDHMANAGTVVVNSNVETFSVVTGEALAMGRPVIATRCGGPTAFIAPENGLLIPVGDTEALRNAMIRMATHGGRYSPEAIRRSVEERFSNDAVGTGFLSVYERCLQHG